MVRAIGATKMISAIGASGTIGATAPPFSVGVTLMGGGDGQMAEAWAASVPVCITAGSAVVTTCAWRAMLSNFGCAPGAMPVL